MPPSPESSSVPVTQPQEAAPLITVPAEIMSGVPQPETIEPNRSPVTLSPEQVALMTPADVERAARITGADPAAALEVHGEARSAVSAGQDQVVEPQIAAAAERQVNSEGVVTQ